MFKAWFSLRLHVQLALASGVLLAITISVAAWFNLQSQKQKLIENTRLEAISLAENLSIVGSYFLITDKLDELEALLIRSTSFPNITMMRVITADGQTLSHVKKTASGEIVAVYDLSSMQVPGKEDVKTITNIDWHERQLTVWKPIKTSTLLGWIKIESSLGGVIKLHEQAVHDNIKGAIVAIIIDVLSLLAILFVPARNFRKVVNFANSMTDKAGAQIDYPGGSYEINSLIKALNSSSSRLASQRDEIQKKSDGLIKLNDTLERCVKHRTEALETSNANLRLFNNAVEQNPTVTIITDVEGNIEYVNPAFSTVTGYTAEEVSGKTLAVLKSGGMSKEIYQDVWAAIISGKTWSGLIRNKKRNGEIYWDQTQISPIRNAQGEISHFLVIQSDVTEKRHMEEQLRRSQRMDAMGKLTGGIAHDYNNLLAIIMGYAELLNEHLSHDSRLAEYAQEIHRTTERGTKLTRKLLAFSQHKATDATIVDINALLQAQQLMLEKTLTARIKLVYDLADNLPLVEMASGDLEDAIINMSINALHAMPSGGQLTIRTCNAQLNALEAQQLQLKAGGYVLLSITDTGCGMNEVTREKIFDPFYSTKGDLGTGLGLSQVYGFVQSCGGSIEVYSKPGHGSRFALYFLRSQQTRMEAQTLAKDTSPIPQGSETLLVVDDEPALLELARDMLSAQGYRVLTANDGEQALLVLEQEAVDLIISDVVMPNMDGYQLAALVQQRYPHIKLQMVSGFADDRHKGNTHDTLHQNMLHKPYALKTLLTRVRSLLDT